MTYARREILKQGATAIAASLVTRTMVSAQSPLPAVRMAQTPVLNIAYEETGDPRGFPVILLHGFPDDARAYDEVIAPLLKRAFARSSRSCADTDRPDSATRRHREWRNKPPSARM